MPVTPLAITGTGMVTAVGLDSRSTCAAIRCAIDNFQETRFMDDGGEWQIGAEVELEKPWRGRTKLLEMVKRSISECLDSAAIRDTTDIPLLLSLPEADRPGRVIDDDEQFVRDLQLNIGSSFSPYSRVFSHGHTAAAISLQYARDVLDDNRAEKIIVAGVDSLLSAPALSKYQQDERLLTSQNSNGFIPGEGSAALLVERDTRTDGPRMYVHGIGSAVEKAIVNSGLPLRADGLRDAINQSLSDSGCEMQNLDYRIADITGEHYYFKEASLALSRTLKEVVPEFDILHPTDCVGEMGAAAGHAIFCYQNHLTRMGIGKSVIAHFGDENGKRAAAVMSSAVGPNNG